MASKIQERIYLEWFLKKVELSHGHIVDHERPDFIGEIEGQVTGIEITNIYNDPEPGRKGSPAKKSEAQRSKWLRSLAAQYYAQQSVPIYFNIYISSGHYDELTDDLLSFFMCAIELPEWDSVKRKIESNHARCTAYITRLPVSFSQYSRWICCNDHICFVGPITARHICNALDRKGARVARYSECCKRLWLLLVADTTWNSGRFIVDGHLDVKVPDGYEKAWLLDYPKVCYPLSMANSFSPGGK